MKFINKFKTVLLLAGLSFVAVQAGIKEDIEQSNIAGVSNYLDRGRDPNFEIVTSGGAAEIRMPLLHLALRNPVSSLLEAQKRKVIIIMLLDRGANPRKTAEIGGKSYTLFRSFIIALTSSSFGHSFLSPTSDAAVTQKVFEEMKIIAELLYNAGAPVNVADESGYTPRAWIDMVPDVDYRKKIQASALYKYLVSIGAK